MGEVVAPGQSGPVTAPPAAKPVTAPTSGSGVRAPAHPGPIVLPGGWVPRVPRERIAWAMGSGEAAVVVWASASPSASAGGEGTATCVVSAVVYTHAQASGVGTATGQLNHHDAEATGMGAASALVRVEFHRHAAATGEGTATATAYPALSAIAQQVGFGAAAASVWEVEYGRATAVSTGVATAIVRAVANAAAGASGMGEASATAVGVTWQDSGITKTGQQELPDSTWTTITGWAVRSGYPDTVIESNGIRVPAGTYTINAQTYWDRVTSLRTCGVRVTLDGTPIPGLEHSEASNDRIRAVTDTVTIGEGLVQIQGYSEGLGSYRRVNATDTWLTIERA